MIDQKTIDNLIVELEKTGNVYASCKKVGVSAAQFYRWRKDKKFNQKVLATLRIGRSNKCDIAEHALMLAVSKGDMTAIRYVLSNLSKDYKPKRQRVIIEHQTKKSVEKIPEITLEDILDKWDEIQEREKSRRENTQQPPPKPAHFIEKQEKNN